MQVEVDNNFPIVTAIIPCHNHRNWLPYAVNSIVKQDYPKGNLRIMVVDDGSTDESVSPLMLGATVGRDITHPDGIRQVCGVIDDVPIIMMIRPEAGGPSVARNLGIKAGMDGTDIFALLDSDDMYQPRKIAASVEKFIRSPKIGAVYSDYDTLSHTTGLRIRQFKEPFSRDRLVKECIVNCDSLVLKEAIVQCGDFDEEMRVCEDYDFWMRISEKYVISHIPENLLTIRVGDHSSSAQVKSEVWQQNWNRVMQKAQQRRSGNGI